MDRSIIVKIEGLVNIFKLESVTVEFSTLFVNQCHLFDINGVSNSVNTVPSDIFTGV